MAISNEFQFKGNGTELLNEFKKICLEKKIISLIAVNADNNEIYYFIKQGFKERNLISEIIIKSNVAII